MLDNRVMARRVRLFSLGILIGLFGLYLSTYLPGENSVAKTLNGYIDYFSPSKRVIWHLNQAFSDGKSNFSNKAICQMIYYDLSEEDILGVLNHGKINFSLSDKDGKKVNGILFKLFVVENIIRDKPVAVHFSLYADDKESEVISFHYIDDKEQCVN